MRTRGTGGRQWGAYRGVLAMLVATAGLPVMPARAGEAGVAELPTVACAEACDHVGQQVRVEFTVESSRLLADRGLCFLNSRKNHRDDDNFTVVLFREGLERFAEAGIDDPAEHFRQRTLRVRGVVAERDGKPQIVVELPNQVEIVESADE
jgi:hypothetical protein